MADNTQALTQLIKILQPLSSEDRHRNIDAALTFLGERKLAVPIPAPEGNSSGDGGGHTSHPTARATRMKQYGITAELLESVFDFREDNTFAILDAPGNSMREQALHIYVLTGLGTFLATGERLFTDDLARANCAEHSCLDGSNHAKTLSGKHPEFNGDKNSGWTITVPGLKRGAELVKQVADKAAK